MLAGLGWAGVAVPVDDKSLFPDGLAHPGDGEHGSNITLVFQHEQCRIQNHHHGIETARHRFVMGC